MRWVALQIAAAVAFLVVLLAAQGVRLPLGDGGRFTVRAAFSDAAGLSASSRAPVTIAGVAAGKVKSIGYDPERGRAVAELELEPEARGVLRTDASVTVVPRSALQDLTVDLTAGVAETALEDGDWIAPSRAAGTVALDRLVGTLDTDTRAHAQVLLAELARGLEDNAPVMRAAVRERADALDPAQRLTAAVAERRAQLTALVGDLAAITGTLAEREAAVGAGIAAARTTLGVTGERERAVADTVDELAPTLTTLRAALDATVALEQPLVPALRGLRPTARALPATLDSLRAAAGDGERLVATLDALNRDAGPGLDAVRGAAQAFAPAADDLTAALEDGGEFVDAVDANRDGIGLLGERFSGVLSTADANGIILRGLGFFEPFDPANFGEPGATGRRLERLESLAVRALVKTCRQENAIACLSRYLIPGLPGAVR